MRSFGERAIHVAIRGFALIGAVSTAVWVVTLLTSKNHDLAWEILSGVLGCFLLAALLEIWTLSRKLDKGQKIEEFLNVLTEVSKGGHELLEGVCESTYDDWVSQGKAKIAEYSTHYAQDFAFPFDQPSLEGNVKLRLNKLDAIKREVRATSLNL